GRALPACAGQLLFPGGVGDLAAPPSLQPGRGGTRPRAPAPAADGVGGCAGPAAGAIVRPGWGGEYRAPPLSLALGRHRRLPGRRHQPGPALVRAFGAADGGRAGPHRGALRDHQHARCAGGGRFAGALRSPSAGHRAGGSAVGVVAGLADLRERRARRAAGHREDHAVRACARARPRRAGCRGGRLAQEGALRIAPRSVPLAGDRLAALLRLGRESARHELSMMRGAIALAALASAAALAQETPAPSRVPPPEDAATGTPQQPAKPARPAKKKAPLPPIPLEPLRPVPLTSEPAAGIPGAEQPAVTGRPTQIPAAPVELSAPAPAAAAPIPEPRTAEEAVPVRPAAPAQQPAGTPRSDSSAWRRLTVFAAAGLWAKSHSDAGSRTWDAAYGLSVGWDFWPGLLEAELQVVRAGGSSGSAFANAEVT